MSEKEQLTEAQQKIFDYIKYKVRKVKKTVVVAPSIREISKHFGFTPLGSQSTIHRIAKKGWLKKMKKKGGGVYIPVDFIS